ncbi:MAG: hypothetical protein GPJ14_01055 [Microcystis aeruginosa G11-01]|nr:hypothetical protein [Microcystis aeruginosa LL11-07]NCR87830.1 hypothetical protein [Microcystis aeruginosa G13-10]NCS32964.1 hypothetical protein [Microcystis aeruginosa G11-01]
MISVQFDYAAPDSLEAAVKLLNDDHSAVILAGSHSLMAALKQGGFSPPLLIDLLKIPDLGGINRQANGALEIGSMTTLANLAESKEVKDNFTALAEAANGIGDPQIRNWQRIGDIFGYGDLACDLPTVALALEATFETVGVSGKHDTHSTQDLLSRAVPASWMLPDIVCKLHFPACREGTGTAYLSLRDPASRSAICSVAALVEPGVDRVTVSKCRVAVGGALSYPIRLTQVEAALEGKEPTAANIADAAQLAIVNVTAALATRDDLTIRSSLYASAEYRTHLIGVLTKRALMLAAKRSSFIADMGH